MRKLFLAVLVAALLPAAVAAQGPPTRGETRMAPKKIPRLITSDVAASTALNQVRADLGAGRLSAWGGRSGTRAEPQQGGGGGGGRAALKVGGALFNPTGGKSGQGAYVVGVTAPNTAGHVRVIVDAKTGAVLGSRVGSWDWGNSPDWWVKGLNAPPTEKKGEDTLSAKPRTE